MVTFAVSQFPASDPPGPVLSYLPRSLVSIRLACGDIALLFYCFFTVFLLVFYCSFIGFLLSFLRLLGGRFRIGGRQYNSPLCCYQNSIIVHTVFFSFFFFFLFKKNKATLGHLVFYCLFLF